MAKFALIVPPNQVSCLPTEAQRMGYHMALGQELVFSPAYLRRYCKLARLGHFIMVDNGAAEPKEERLSFQTIIDYAEQVGADEIILPDVLRDSDATHKAMADNFSLIMKIPVAARCVVPQGDTLDEWFQCLLNLARNWEFQTIGVPKHLERYPDGRAEAVRMVRSLRMFDGCHLHMLGIWNNPKKEISQLAGLRVRGIDSGAPIAYAQAHLPFEGAERASLDWDGPRVSAAQLGRNLRLVREWLGG